MKKGPINILAFVSVEVFMSHEECGKKVATAISELRQEKHKEVLLVHHDDADGLCSAMHACLTEASKGFGIADGHEYAANVVAPVDKKEDLIRNAEEILCA